MKKLIFMGCALLSADLVLGVGAVNIKRPINMTIPVKADVAFIIAFEGVGPDGQITNKEVILCDECGKTSEDKRTVKLVPEHGATVEMKIECNFLAEPTKKGQGEPFPYSVTYFLGARDKGTTLYSAEEAAAACSTNKTLRTNEELKFVFDFNDTNVKPGKYRSSFAVTLSPKI